MTFKNLIGPGACLGLALLLIGCESYTQTTSGSEYLKRYAEQAQATGAGRLDPEIRDAADVEPILTFPARVGIARIDGGRLSAIPQAEGEAWLGMSRKLGSGWGEFVTISPLIFALAAPPQSGYGSPAPGCGHAGDCLGVIQQTVRDIRVAAARQHTDVVLIYEVVGRSQSTPNPLAITNLALLPMFFMPSQNVEAEGRAQAVLLDVRNGYTYGFASAVVEDAAFTLASLIGSFEATEEVADEAKTAAAIELSKEVGEMAQKLRLELAEKRAAQAAKR
jgi:hypothetical protein